jgi:hypothetical protein
MVEDCGATRREAGAMAAGKGARGHRIVAHKPAAPVCSRAAPLTNLYDTCNDIQPPYPFILHNPSDGARSAGPGTVGNVPAIHSHSMPLSSRWGCRWVRVVAHSA